MSVQRKMFDYVRALNLSSTNAALEKDGLLASMIRPASTVFPWAACALGDLQVRSSQFTWDPKIDHLLIVSTGRRVCEPGAGYSCFDKAVECRWPEVRRMCCHLISTDKPGLPRSLY